MMLVLDPEKPEADFVTLGNKNLPPDIRILAWAPIPDEFNPRQAILRVLFIPNFSLFQIQLSQPILQVPFPCQ